ncbi:MAG: Dienelactone hydrolase family, partial [uncultured Blastococcus sp.]
VPRPREPPSRAATDRGRRRTRRTEPHLRRRHGVLRRLRRAGAGSAGRRRGAPGRPRAAPVLRGARRGVRPGGDRRRRDRLVRAHRRSRGGRRHPGPRLRLADPRPADHTRGHRRRHRRGDRLPARAGRRRPAGGHRRLLLRRQPLLAPVRGWAGPRRLRGLLRPAVDGRRRRRPGAPAHGDGHRGGRRRDARGRPAGTGRGDACRGCRRGGRRLRRCAALLLRPCPRGVGRGLPGRLGARARADRPGGPPV